MSALDRHASAAETSAELAARLDARHRKPLMSYFLRRVESLAAAEDLTQEVFLRILRRDDRPSLENDEAFLFSIARNLLRDRARRARARHAAHHESLDAGGGSDMARGRLPLDLVEDRTPDRVVMSQESLSEVLRALDELGELTRDIFILYRLEHMKQREIGALYGMSANATEKYIRKATAHLARRFGRP